MATNFTSGQDFSMAETIGLHSSPHRSYRSVVSGEKGALDLNDMT